MREKPVVQSFEQISAGRDPVIYGSVSETAVAMKLSQPRVSLLIKTGKPARDGSRLFFLADWKARREPQPDPVPAPEPEPEEPVIKASAVTVQEVPQPTACPQRIINFTSTGIEWLCGIVESGKYFCQELDCERCKIHQHIEEQKRRAER